MKKRWKSTIMLCVVLLVVMTIFFEGDPGKSNTEELIPRNVLFGNPVFISPKISPQGDRIAYLAPSENGINNIWVKSIDKEDAVQVTKDKHRGIKYFDWTHDGLSVVYLQDNNGDENFHVFQTSISSGLTRDLTPFQNKKACNLIIEKDYILTAINIENPSLFDMYRIDLKTGAVELDTKNPGDVIYLTGSEWIADRNGRIFAAKGIDLQTGNFKLKILDRQKNQWTTIREWPQSSSLFNGYIVGVGEDNKSLLVLSTEGEDKTKLVRIDMNGNTSEVIASSDKVDLWTDDFIFNPFDGSIQAFAEEYLRPEWHIIDNAIRSDFALLKTIHGGEFRIVSRDTQDKKWIVKYESPDDAAAYYYYNREKGEIKFLSFDRPELAKYRLAKVQPMILKVRDGLKLTAYLSLPVQDKPEKHPMVLYVHGGPTARDSYVFDPVVQFLANRGYAILQVNFRGSVGFGGKFQALGNRQIGVGYMQHDLTDSVKWAIDKGYADSKKIAIFGNSYGGYAALAGLTFTPELYACGVSGCGPADIKTMLQSFPSYFGPIKKLIVEIFGDAENDEKYNENVSPLYHVSKITAPLFIVQGVNDPKVKKEQSDRIIKILRENNIKVKYLVFPDEGHGIQRPENKMQFYAYLEEFLKEHLGGNAEKFEIIGGSSGQME
jgi:dipeptidyl aminopeptidase/acylaminoacyl peptidase